MVVGVVGVDAAGGVPEGHPQQRGRHNPTHSTRAWQTDQGLEAWASEACESEERSASTSSTAVAGDKRSDYATEVLISGGLT